ncbi:MAG: dihydropteroate synthase [Methanomicrobiales archaeon]|nr:dihydropteroate synthase [Methanomicrobiales archaeon]
MPAVRISTKTLSIKLGTCILKFDEPKVMGIVNNTPDSFSGDGIGGDVEMAVARGLAMFDSGASMVDVGGESTRPGAGPVSSDLEMTRTLPVVEQLSRIHPGRVSIDTMKPEVAEGALFAGAALVNDVSGLRDRRMIDVVAEHDAGAIVMHMLGEPRTMQVRPRYKDVVEDILQFLSERVEVAETAGVNPRKIMVDPGIGFGKTLDHNLEILGRLSEFRALGKPIVIGVSRKAFIGKLTGQPTDGRLEGSIAAALLAVREGADVVRVHDVPETVRALKVSSGIISRLPRSRR